MFSIKKRPHSAVPSREPLLIDDNKGTKDVDPIKEEEEDDVVEPIKPT